MPFLEKEFPQLVEVMKSATRTGHRQRTLPEHIAELMQNLREKYGIGNRFERYRRMENPDGEDWCNWGCSDPAFFKLDYNHCSRTWHIPHSQASRPGPTQALNALQDSGGVSPMVSRSANCGSSSIPTPAPATGFIAKISTPARPKKRASTTSGIPRSEFMWAILEKLTPARRVLFLLGVVLLDFPQRRLQLSRKANDVEVVEFDLRFYGGALLFILLMLEVADRVVMKRDLEIARDIQSWLLPANPPEVPGLAIAFATRPANTVAGDYYDVFARTPSAPANRPF